ncbi:uncharacterized protein A1O9_03607 [Exophiala aquamarina CBS 119918]|uniref:RTA1 like protein n=1 Tax=Exophiala aquamarina CBS 119918 TaxID=1182545 RepID=A0A072PFB1_9EURO|nr:uncharacterized protein A1O9_03607 [Exophiala aquamarina CBS 119918]KEF58764.1 hypothetical protein A1O9_03607 [Exophiala aquamarina CBS 119918]
MSGDFVPLTGRLVSRDNLTSFMEDHAGKTPQKWAVEGRYYYSPSFAAAAVFLAVYILATIINLGQFFFYRSWFWWPMVLGVAMELVGYAARAVSTKNLDDRVGFIIQMVFILVAPAVMAASCYMAFGRLVLWIIPPRFQSFRHLWLPARRITPLFVGFDVLSFFIQVVGGVIVSNADTLSRLNLGKNIVLVGLGVQLATFGFFVIATTRLTILLRTQLKNESLPKNRNWTVLLIYINTASGLILLRSVYRFIEYAMGLPNYLASHEVFFYCLDAFIILTVVTGFICIHPGQYIPYIKLRRRAPEFSSNVDKGLFKRVARGGPQGVVEIAEHSIRLLWATLKGLRTYFLTPVVRC